MTQELHREGDAPTETPHCAGRIAVAHARTPMVRDGDEWLCPVCEERWEIDDDEPVLDCEVEL